MQQNDRRPTGKPAVACVACALYSAGLSAWLCVYFAMAPWTTGAAVGAVAGGLLAWTHSGREALRLLAATHIGAAAVGFLLHVASLWILHLDTVTVIFGAAALCAIPAVYFGQLPPRQLPALNLPAGYEHVERLERPWSLAKKLGFVTLASIVLSVHYFVGPLLLFSVLFFPFLFAIYLLVQLLRKKEFEAPFAARVIAIRSRRPKPAQRRSQYTLTELENDDHAEVEIADRES